MRKENKCIYIFIYVWIWRNMLSFPFSVALLLFSGCLPAYPGHPLTSYSTYFIVSLIASILLNYPPSAHSHISLFIHPALNFNFFAGSVKIFTEPGLAFVRFPVSIPFQFVCQKYNQPTKPLKQINKLACFNLIGAALRSSRGFQMFCTS
jgi:hypothetical protein